jgi:hypothetical protein
MNDIIIFIGRIVITYQIPFTIIFGSLNKKEFCGNIPDDDIPLFLKEYCKIKHYTNPKIEYLY